MEVIPVSSDTSVNNDVQPVTNNSDPQNSDNFVQLYEKEKQKTGFVGMLPINFSALSDVQLDFTKNDDTINDISDKTDLHNDTARHLKSAASVSMQDNSRTDTSTKKTDAASDQNKIAQANNINNAVNSFSKPLYGDLAITPEFYDMLVTAKNSSGELRMTNADELLLQIQDKVKFLQDNGKMELSMELQPEGLGSLLLSITKNKGVVSINIFAEQQAKETLMENIKQLEAALRAGHINIDNINIITAVNGRKNGEYPA